MFEMPVEFGGLATPGARVL